MDSDNLSNFCSSLHQLVGQDISIRINNNRSTMVSVKWDPLKTHVSLHKMFLDAPPEVCQALAGYIKFKGREPPKIIRAFIEKKIAMIDHSQFLKKVRLSPKGSFYDLQEIMSRVNERYFANQLDLKITWHGSPFSKNRAKCTLGLYYDTLKLIKISRLLDSDAVPEYVVEFVVYHEMLHAACPAYIDSQGRCRVHGDVFKRREKEFHYYEEAEAWLKRNQGTFFEEVGYKHGRSQQMGKYKTSKRKGRRQEGKTLFTSGKRDN